MVRLSLVLVAPAGSSSPRDDAQVWASVVDGGVVVTDDPAWAEAFSNAGFLVVRGSKDLGIARERGRAAVPSGWAWYAEAGELPGGGDPRGWLEEVSADTVDLAWVEADRVDPDVSAVVAGEGRLTAPHRETRLARTERGWSTGPAPRLRGSPKEKVLSPFWVVARLRSGRTGWVEAELAARAAVVGAGQVEALGAASRRLRGLGHSAYAAEIARRALPLSRSPDGIGGIVAYALTELDAGRPDGAVRAVLAANERGLNHPDLDLLAARGHLAIGGPESARSAAQRAAQAFTAQDPGSVPRAGTPETACLVELEAWLAADDLDQAEAAWRKLTRVQRRGQAARLGRLEIDARRLVPGVAAEIAARGDTAGPDAWAIGAFAAEREADISRAHMFLARLEGEPVYVAPHRAKLAAAARASVSAEAMLQRLDGGVERWDLEDPRTVAEDLAEEGRLEEAHRAIVEALRRDPADGTSWVDLAVILDRAGLRDPAVLAMRAAVELDPMNPDWRAGLAALCGRAGLYADAALHARLAGDRPDMRTWLMALGVEGPDVPGPIDVSIAIEKAGVEVLDRLSLSRGRLRLEVFAVGGAPAGTWPFPVVSVPTGGEGRLEAIERARGAVLWFLAGEARPAPDDLTGRLAGGRPRVLSGRTWIAHRHLRDARDRALAETPQEVGPLWRTWHFDDLWMPTAVARRILPDVASFPDGGAREWGLRVAHAGIEMARIPGVMLDRRRTVAEAVAEAEAQGAEEVAIRNLHPGIVGIMDLGPLPESALDALRTVVEAEDGPSRDAALELARAPDDASQRWTRVRAAAIRRGVASASVGRRCAPFPTLNVTSVVVMQDPSAEDDRGLALALSRIRLDAHGPIEVVIVHHTEVGPGIGAVDVRRVRVPAASTWEAAVNTGLRESCGATALVIQEGARLVPSWRPRLMRHLESWSDVGLVAMLRATTAEDLRAAGEAFADAHAGAHAWPVLVTRVGGVLLRRELWSNVGGLAPGLGPLAWTDLGLRARKAGFRVRQALDVLVGGVDLPDPKAEENAVFFSRWGVEPSDRSAVRDLAEAAGEAPAGPRIEGRTSVPVLLVDGTMANLPLREAPNRETLDGAESADVDLIYEI